MSSHASAVAWDPIEDVFGKPINELIDRGVEDLKNLPESWTNCAKDPLACADKEFRRLGYRALWPIIERYKSHLFNQANGRSKMLPEYFVEFAQPHYRTVDLKLVQYAENVDTIHGQAITWENHIFFTKPIDFAQREDVRLVLHELEHVVQYKQKGGYKEFISEYIAKAAGKILERRSFDVHDFINEERAAIRKADRLYLQAPCSRWRE